MVKLFVVVTQSGSFSQLWCTHHDHGGLSRTTHGVSKERWGQWTIENTLEDSVRSTIQTTVQTSLEALVFDHSEWHILRPSLLITDRATKLTWLEGSQCDTSRGGMNSPRSVSAVDALARDRTVSTCLQLFSNMWLKKSGLNSRILIDSNETHV